MSDPAGHSDAPKLKPVPAPIGKPFKINLVTHCDVCRAFGVSSAVLMRAVRKGEFQIPHSTMGTMYLFDRAIIEHRLEKGTWPANARFRGG